MAHLVDESEPDLISNTKNVGDEWRFRYAWEDTGRVVFLHFVSSPLLEIGSNTEIGSCVSMLCDEVKQSLEDNCREATRPVTRRSLYDG